MIIVSSSRGNIQIDTVPKLCAANAAGLCPFMNGVRPHYLSPNAPDCLHSIVPAVALSSAARQLGRPDLLQKANQHYGTALRKLGKRLRDPVIVKHDATLLTIFLLELYEVSQILQEECALSFRVFMSGSVRGHPTKLRDRSTLSYT